MFCSRKREISNVIMMHFRLIRVYYVIMETQPQPEEVLTFIVVVRCL